MPLKTMSIILFIFSPVLVLTLKAQKKEMAPFPDTYHKNIMLEFLGSSIPLGINYDMRLHKGRLNGIGFKVGLSSTAPFLYFSDTAPREALISMPLEINYLEGKRKGTFIAGLGLINFIDLIDTKFSAYYVGSYLVLGYRYQPLDNGFMFQINWNPGFSQHGYNLGWVGISVGYGFK